MRPRRMASSNVSAMVPDEVSCAKDGSSMLPEVFPETEMLVLSVLLLPLDGEADCWTLTDEPAWRPESGTCVAVAPEVSRLP